MRKKIILDIPSIIFYLIYKFLLFIASSKEESTCDIHTVTDVCHTHHAACLAEINIDTMMYLAPVLIIFSATNAFAQILIRNASNINHHDDQLTSMMNPKQIISRIQILHGKVCYKSQ